MIPKSTCSPTLVRPGHHRTTPQPTTGAPGSTWLNDLVLVASGLRAVRAVIIDLYAVR